MCRTIGLLVILALGLLVAPLGVAALPAGPVPRLGLLSAGPQPTAPDWRQRAPFLAALRELGWVDGHNLALEFRWADGRAEVLPALAAELVRLRVDLIVAFGSHASAAAKQATAAIPIVMAEAIDPIGTGLAASLAGTSPGRRSISRRSPANICNCSSRRSRKPAASRSSGTLPPLASPPMRWKVWRQDGSSA